MARNQLNRLYWLKKEIEQIEDQIKELTVMSSVKLTGMPRGSGVSSPVEQFTERMFYLQEKLTRKLNEYIEERIAIENTIESFDEPEIRLIARKRYIENKSWERIGREMLMDRTTAYKKLKGYEDQHIPCIELKNNQST